MINKKYEWVEQKLTESELWLFVEILFNFIG